VPKRGNAKVISNQLVDLIAPLCPLDGVSIGREDDPATWALQFAAGATAAQRAAAQAALAAFDPSAPVVPASVKMWQAKAALAAAGKLDAASGFVAASGSVPLQLAWEYATDISRTSAAVGVIGALLEMSAADLDALFIAADAITV